MKSYNLEFKYGVSRGRDTMGYNIVTLYVNGKKIARAMGGGYDMFGTCLGKFMTETFQDELKKLPATTTEGFYGLIHYDKTSGQRVKLSSTTTITYLDGACGEESMRAILEAIGYDMRRIVKNAYIVERKKP